MTVLARTAGATVALAALALTLTLTACSPVTGADPAQAADPAAAADDSAADPAVVADPADPDEAKRLVAEAFVRWGYPAGDAVDTMAEMTVTSLQPGCAVQSGFLDGFVPNYVNSFNTTNGEAPDLTEVEVGPVIEQAFEELCADPRQGLTTSAA